MTVLPKEEFTLQEWAQYCYEHPEYLTINRKEVKRKISSKTKSSPMSITFVRSKRKDEYQKSSLSQKHSISNHRSEKLKKNFVKYLVMSIRQGIENIKDIVTPLDILRERLSRSEIIKNQKKEFSKIYTACLAGEDFEYTNIHHPSKFKYKLVSDLLLIFDNFYKILLPPSMIGLLLSFTHLLGHKGISKMMVLV